MKRNVLIFVSRPFHGSIDYLYGSAAHWTGSGFCELADPEKKPEAVTEIENSTEKNE